MRRAFVALGGRLAFASDESLQNARSSALPNVLGGRQSTENSICYGLLKLFGPSVKYKNPLTSA
jgi:hypothetical protein